MIKTNDEIKDKIKDIISEGVEKGVAIGECLAYTKSLIMILSFMDEVEKFHNIFYTKKGEGCLESLQRVAKEIKKNERGDIMKEIAKDIIFMEINDDDTISLLKEKFITIMKKYNIKHGELQENGDVHVASFEWTMCKSLFMETLFAKINLDMFLMNIPKELKY